MKLDPKVMRLLSALVALAVVALVAVLAGRGGETGGTDSTARNTAVASLSPTTTRAAASPVASPASSAAPARVAGVPERAYETLVEIDAGRWPDSANAPGTKGGEQWMNRGGDLPRADADGRAVSYREWDVNPKQRNRSRDAERIVTGSDGSAWYTGDHYTTFTRMR
ncbi:MULTISPECIES: ribonuclease domain-containing protein [Nocardia]|uniref:Ribonuclease domain-containing protein n=1 Tax=Nocardia aurea TaxID=2144174 RepID=A0ABV3FQJ4_9NOCA|nr:MULTISPECIES: ribonuclease domain-containing protein [Nocardia]